MITQDLTSAPILTGRRTGHPPRLLAISIGTFVLMGVLAMGALAFGALTSATAPQARTGGEVVDGWERAFLQAQAARSIGDVSATDAWESALFGQVSATDAWESALFGK